MMVQYTGEKCNIRNLILHFLTFVRKPSENLVSNNTSNTYQNFVLFIWLITHSVRKSQ